MASPGLFRTQLATLEAPMAGVPRPLALLSVIGPGSYTCIPVERTSSDLGPMAQGIHAKALLGCPFFTQSCFPFVQTCRKPT